MSASISNRLSSYVYCFCVVLMCYSSFVFYPRWEKGETQAAIAWDVSGYYWYLPSIFIYHDLKHQSFKDSILEKYRPTNTDFQQAMQVPNGNYVMKYSSGMAVMYLPFFTAAHLVAGSLGYPRDGFSLPYQFAIQLGGLLISLLGLWYLRKLLLLFYEDKVVAVTLGLLVLGSNYLNYAGIDTGMSHCWLFTVYVFLLLNTHYFYQSLKIKYAIRVGLLVGLATLTRPTDVISCLIPLLWGMESVSVSAIRKQAALVASNFRSLLVAGICAGCIISIQLIYWKYVSGHWIVYSYGDQGFSWRHPHSNLYAFNYKCGWLTYAPGMMFAFIGIIPFIKSGKNKVAILAFFLLNYYIVSAWDIWWYGGRAMVQSYPILIFPVAALVSAAMNNKIIGWIFFPFYLLFLYFNIWMTIHYHKGGLYDSENMSKRYFWRVAGRWSAPERTVFLMDNTHVYEETPVDTQLVYQNNFANDTGACYVTDAKGVKSILLNKDNQSSPDYKFPLMGKNARWVRVQATFHCEDKEYNLWKMCQFMADVTNKGNKVKENMIRVYRMLEPHETKQMIIDVKLPNATYDSIDIHFWNAGSDKPIWISDIKAWTFNK